MNRPAPTSICSPKRRCVLCLQYRAPMSGSQQVPGRLPFICAECMRKRS